MNDGPTVWCTNHVQQFRKVGQEVDDDGTRQLIEQYWPAECDCAVEVIMAVPREADAN
jgi:hypothetical protein